MTVEEFAAALDGTDWRYFEQWQPEGVDGETGEPYDSWLLQAVIREAPMADGRVWCWNCTVGENDIQHFEHLREHLLKFWNMGWEDSIRRNGVLLA